VKGCFISLMVSAGEKRGETCQGRVDNKSWQAAKATTRENKKEQCRSENRT
jgi:hypothetical protein